jgi:hypothetical protein
MAIPEARRWIIALLAESAALGPGVRVGSCATHPQFDPSDSCAKNEYLDKEYQAMWRDAPPPENSKI